MNNDFDNFGEPVPPRPNPEGRPQGDRPENAPPRRRPRSEDFDREMQEAPKEISVLGLLSLLQGVGSLLASFVPCVGVLGIIGGAFGLVLGVIGYFVAKGSTRQSNSLPIAGIVVNLLAILIGGLWLFLLVGIGGRKDAGPDVTGEPSTTITAIELDEEYDTNELAADTKYKNKTLVVSGKIKKITRDDKPGKITIELVGTPGSTVDCHFDRAQHGDLGTLIVGEDVTIRGNCKGKVQTWVTLERCVLDVKKPDMKKPTEKTPDAGVIAITAEALEAEYDANVIAADAKHKGKLLELTGKVFRISRNKPGKATVELESEMGQTIDCDFTAKDGQVQLAAVAIGDTLVIRGTCQGKPDDIVTLGGCTLVKKLDKPADGPPVVVTLEALEKAYEGNVVAADAKYKGKFLEVMGPVLRVARNKPGKITVVLGSDESATLVCDFLAKDWQAQLAEVNVGDKLTIRGTCRGNGEGILLLENSKLVKK
ncbi:MAG: OB-fold putative lipoprotein [Planctomycetes bacterium]|nr:OB-fold putative lipoprotein [Planctomycetota bacterium]